MTTRGSRSKTAARGAPLIGPIDNFITRANDAINQEITLLERRVSQDLALAKRSSLGLIASDRTPVQARNINTGPIIDVHAEIHSIPNEVNLSASNPLIDSDLESSMELERTPELLIKHTPDEVVEASTRQLRGRREGAIRKHKTHTRQLSKPKVIKHSMPKRKHRKDTNPNPNVDETNAPIDIESEESHWIPTAKGDNLAAYDQLLERMGELLSIYLSPIESRLTRIEKLAELSSPITNIAS